MIFEEREYLPDYGGYYRCPNGCGHPDYPPPKWKSEKGFAKHLGECKALLPPVPAPAVREVFANCPDCGQEILELSSCWWMREKVVCLDCHEPYLEAGVGHHGPAGWEPPDITLEG